MGKIAFIVGGARSGKSNYALKMAAKHKKAAFVATCEALDNEMAARIKKHREERPKNWQTFEEPVEVAALIGNIPAGCGCVLIDCLTLLVSNMLLKKKSAKKIEEEVKAILRVLKKRKSPSILVSNEVGLGIVPNSRLGRDFRDIAGVVNKLVAERADRVLFMVSGIPWRIK